MKIIQIEQNLKNENLDNLIFVLHITLIPIDCHMGFEHIVKVKLLNDLNSHPSVISVLYLIFNMIYTVEEFLI